MAFVQYWDQVMAIHSQKHDLLLENSLFSGFVCRQGAGTWNSCLMLVCRLPPDLDAVFDSENAFLVV